MEIRIYSINDYLPDECLGIIDDYSSFNFTKSFKKVGTWSLKGYVTEKVREILEPGNLIWVNSRISGLIDGVEFNTDEEGHSTYEVYGSELKNVLSYRVLWHNFFYTPGGNVPNVEGWMRQLVYYSCIVDETTQEMYLNENRGLIGNVETEDNNIKLNNIGTPQYDTYFQIGEGLLEKLTDMAVSFDTNKGLQIGFDIECPNARNTIFKVYEGADRRYSSSNPLIISREYDNVAALNYTRSNKNTINVVRIEGDTKFAITTSYETKSGFDRREKYVDAKDMTREVRQPDGTTKTLTDAQYTNQLVSKAYEHTQADIRSADAQVVTKGRELPDYSLLGASVTIIDKTYNVRVDDWISEINFIDEQGEIEINYTVGQDIQAKYLTEVK